MSTTYYMDNLFSMSYWRMWCMAAAQGPAVALLIFPYIAFRKLIGWRFRPHYGQARPKQLDFLEPSQIPPDVWHAIEPCVSASLEAGLVWFGCGCKPFIGNKKVFGVVLLQPDGMLIAIVEWNHQRIGQSEASQTIFGCESMAANKGLLLTTANVLASQLEEVLPPWLETRWLPAETSPRDVIAEHRRRIESRTDVVPYNPAQLADHLLKNAQRVFDHLVGTGMLIPLTESDVQRLLRVTPSDVVPAELVR